MNWSEDEAGFTLEEGDFSGARDEPEKFWYRICFAVYTHMPEQSDSESPLQQTANIKRN